LSSEVQIHVFPAIWKTGDISEMVQEREIVSMEHYEVIVFCCLM